MLILMLILMLLNLNIGYADSDLFMRIMSLFNMLGLNLKKFTLNYADRSFCDTLIPDKTFYFRQIFIYFRVTTKNV